MRVIRIQATVAWYGMVLHADSRVRTRIHWESTEKEPVSWLSASLVEPAEVALDNRSWLSLTRPHPGLI
jgi:hypothetical protein